MAYSGDSTYRRDHGSAASRGAAWFTSSSTLGGSATGGDFSAAGGGIRRGDQMDTTSLLLPTAAPLRTYPDARAKLGRLAALPPNWDSYGAGPIAAVALRRAQVVLNALARPNAGATRVPEPFVAPCGDGGVQMEWDGERGSVEVYLPPQGNDLMLVSSDLDGDESERGVATEREVAELVTCLLTPSNASRSTTGTSSSDASTPSR